ncbi:MAG: hypothetical protein ACLP7Q_27090 [Isosphaeraceae bacterium]
MPSKAITVFRVDSGGDLDGTCRRVDPGTCIDFGITYGKHPAILFFLPKLPKLNENIRRTVDWIPLFRSLRRAPKVMWFTTITPGIGRREELHFELSQDEMCCLLDLCKCDEVTRKELLGDPPIAACNQQSGDMGGSHGPAVRAEIATPEPETESTHPERVVDQVPPSPRPSIDFQALAIALRKERKSNQAMLVEYMADKEEATAEEIAEHVHGDSETTDKAMWNNADRTTDSLALLDSRLSFRFVSGRMYREISPA